MGRAPHTDADRTRGERLGAALAAVRRGQGLSQQAVATRASMAISTLRSIEAGRTLDPGIFTVLRLAHALDLRIDDLVMATEDAEAEGAEEAVRGAT